MRQAAWLASNAPLHWQRVGKAVRKKNVATSWNKVMYKAHHPPPKKGLRTQKKNTNKQTPPPHTQTFLFFFLFLSFVSFFCSCLLFLCCFVFCGQKRAKDHEDSIFVYFYSTPQHTAHSTKHRAQSTEHTHTHTHKYCIMKPSGPSWNTRLFRDK